MPISDYVLDNGLASLAGANRRMDICKSLPTTYADATTDEGAGGSATSLGNKTGITIAGPSARAPNGRKVTVPAVTDGAVTETSTGGTDDAEFYAITDPANSRLLHTGSLNAAQMVTDGNVWQTNSFDIGIPNQ
jgi:hypothetical protein